MVTKIYKMEIMVIDFEKRFVEDIITGLENCKYVHPTVIDIDEREVEWSDDHPLNKTPTSKEAFKELFSGAGDKEREELNRALDHEIDFS